MDYALRGLHVLSGFESEGCICMLEGSMSSQPCLGLAAELFLQGLIDRYGRHRVYSDGANWYPGCLQKPQLGALYL